MALSKISKKVLLPTLDLVFKKMLTSNTKRSRRILCYVLTILLNEKVIEAVPLQTYNIQNFKNKDEVKLGHTEVDVKAKLADGRVVSIELQLQPQAYYTERCQVYGYQGYVNQVDKGKDLPYTGIKTVYSINIMNYPKYASDRPAYICFEQLSKEHDIALEDFLLPEDERGKSKRATVKFIFMDLSGDLSNHPELEDFQKFLTTGVAPEGCAEAIKDMEAIVNELNEEEMEMVDVAYQAKVAQLSELMEAKKEGLIEGREEGRAEGRVEGRVEGREEERKKVLENLVHMPDMTIDRIALIVGMSEDEVREELKEYYG